jgi:flavin reductase (DIM6/NTAB) family NADH-FMN oxidoreductase RutF
MTMLEPVRGRPAHPRPGTARLRRPATGTERPGPGGPASARPGIRTDPGPQFLSGSGAGVDDDDYRRAMRQVPGAVTVVTTRVDGVRQGLTVTAVSSVSATPPQLLICINRGTRSAAAISAAGRFGVNYLDTDHLDLASAFAAPIDDHADRFDRADWVDSPAGTPLLRGALVSFDCVVVNEIASGTHAVFIGRVAALATHDGRALLYQHGTYTTTTTDSDQG